MARLLVLLVVAYAWMLALGSQAVARGLAQPLHRNADGRLRRHWSLFKEGLRFFVESLQRLAVGLDFSFFPDQRFT
jgi:hypothetical protein